VAGAAVVAAGATSRVTEGGSDRRRERQACKDAREYLAPGELHRFPPFPLQLSARHLRRKTRRRSGPDYGKPQPRVVTNVKATNVATAIRT
jgi:hypothetical protein